MSDPLRPVRESVELIDAHIRQPKIGSQVMALTTGGTLVKATWKSDSLRYFEAWCESPSIPASVKERMSWPYKSS